MKEPRAELVFEPRDALADRRRRDAQHASGRHETAGFGDLHEHHEAVEAFHSISPLRTSTSA
jgi:hypothetical protein